MRKSLIAFGFFIIITAPAIADTFEKVSDSKVRVTKEVSEDIDIAAVKSNRESLQTSCAEQIAEYDRLITEAQKKGVE